MQLPKTTSTIQCIM